MNIKVTADILKAINMAIINDNKDQQEFLGKVGIDRASIHNWRAGKRKSILPVVWEKLYPFIKPYLQEDIQCRPRKERMKIVKNGIMINITPNIIYAIKRAVKHSKRLYLFCESIGISENQIRKYINGKVKQIRPDSWNALYPHIKQYLTKNLTQNKSMKPEQCKGAKLIKQTKLEEIVEEMIEECGNRADAEENECFGCLFKRICKHIKFSVNIFSKEQIMAELNKEQ